MKELTENPPGTNKQLLQDVELIHKNRWLSYVPKRNK